MVDRVCKDCKAAGISLTRPAPYPGPRCATHNRAAKKRLKERAHELRINKNYELSLEDYKAIKDSQGGKCYICRVATGVAKMLSVDHNHQCEEGHSPEKGCRKCVRALVCGPCNQLIGRYNVEKLLRAIEVLTDPPAQKVLQSRRS